ncbi:hypothetical protein B0J18DRAFT_243981 [Chaetomium sp. MPI-SDFR-AT-0129]|nr:hypothetical protein B0J18DRAFT_243981 [Chaetomium sp. MPI-SDFR-AT-0129]
MPQDPSKLATPHLESHSGLGIGVGPAQYCLPPCTGIESASLPAFQYRLSQHSSCTEPTTIFSRVASSMGTENTSSIARSRCLDLDPTSLSPKLLGYTMQMGLGRWCWCQVILKRNAIWNITPTDHSLLSPLSMAHIVVLSPFVITNDGLIVSLPPGPNTHLDVWANLVLSPGLIVRTFRTFDFGPRISVLQDLSTAVVLSANGSSQRIFPWCSSGFFSFAASKGLRKTLLFESSIPSRRLPLISTVYSTNLLASLCGVPFSVYRLDPFPLSDLHQGLRQPRSKLSVSGASPFSLNNLHCPPLFILPHLHSSLRHAPLLTFHLVHIHIPLPPPPQVVGRIPNPLSPS